jgi:imidazolonepropionase-like amidohydrolase
MDRFSAPPAVRTLLRMIGLMLLACALLPALPVSAAAQPSPSAVIFRNARVFDGVRVLDDHDVLIEGGTVTRVGRRLRAPAGAVTVDARGKTLLPGLIDGHTHTFGEEALKEAVVFGVTTQLDMFTDPGTARSVRAQQRSGGAAGRADLFSAGTLVTAPGGHGTQFGIPIPTLTTPDSAQRFVDARIAEGSDWIKVVYEDGHALGLEFPSIDRATLQAVVEAAHRRDKLAVAHISDAKSARAAIEAGADGLAHLFIDQAQGADFAKMVAKRGAFVIPTLTVLKSMTGEGGGATLLDDPRIAPFLTPVSAAALAQGFPVVPGSPARLLPVAYSTVRQLKAAGVPIVAGSDAPNPGTAHGAALHRELELLVEAGLTPIEALRAATSAPARAFRLTDRGRIAPTLRADVVLVEGDPTRDIRATRAIVGVWKGGHPVDREPFARAASAARQAQQAGATRLEGGVVSDFESGKLDAAIGSWMPSADQLAGGKSTGNVRVVAGGAEEGAYALQIDGLISDAVPYAWYGAMWTPGPQPMVPVDLSATPTLSFWTRGDGKSYRIMIFTEAKGMTPLTRTFTAGPEWQEVRFTWSDFGIDGRGIAGIVLAGGPRPGPFEFRIDQLRLR